MDENQFFSRLATYVEQGLMSIALALLALKILHYLMFQV